MIIQEVVFQCGMAVSNLCHEAKQPKYQTFRAVSAETLKEPKFSSKGSNSESIHEYEREKNITD